MSKIDGKLFESAQDLERLAYGDCPKCQSSLKLKHVGKSSFLGCSAYPECDFTQGLANNDVQVIKEMPDSECPECAHALAVKKGRYGMFIACTNFPSCHFISNTQSQKTTSDYAPLDCPSCKAGKLEKKQNRFGKFFYACNNYPRCKYVLNAMPVARRCEACDYPIMLEQGKDKDTHSCASIDCGHTVRRVK